MQRERVPFVPFVLIGSNWSRVTGTQNGAYFLGSFFRERVQVSNAKDQIG